jgi:hypothetical protein
VRRIYSYRSEIIRYYRGGQFSEALALAREAATTLQHKPGETAYWIACLQARMGDQAMALRIMGEAFEAGAWWYPKQFEDDDLATLRDHPLFKAFIGRSVVAFNRFQRGSPEMTVLAPPGSRRGLLVALHAGGDCMADFAPLWAPANLEGMLVAVPQSSQRMNSDNF